MAAHFGHTLHPRSWLPRSDRRKPSLAGAAARRLHYWRDAIVALYPGDAGLEARARRRIRNAGLSESGVIIEAWKGDLTLRGDAPASVAPRYQQELRRLRGVRNILDFIHPTKDVVD